MIRSAVILAAGLGSRLGPRPYPKGLQLVGEETLIARSLRNLAEVGIEDVLVVTGHLAEAYRELGSRRIFNPEYARSGSLYSLCCAIPHLEEPFLLLESDLIYEKRALDTLLQAPEADLILLSGPSGAGDEVYVWTEAGQLRAMSKQRQAYPGEPAGELVGISKISRELGQRLWSWGQARWEKSLRLDYECDGLVACSQECPIPCCVVSDLLWGEVDDAVQLARAQQLVEWL